MVGSLAITFFCKFADEQASERILKIGQCIWCSYDKKIVGLFFDHYIFISKNKSHYTKQ